MMLRRWFYAWLPWSILVLPVTIFAGWLATARGWDLFGIVLFPPITFFVLGGLTLLLRARPSARAERAVSWLDLAVVGGYHLSLIAWALFGARFGWIIAIAIVLALAAVWVALVQLWRDSARQLRGVVDHYERMAQPSTNPTMPTSTMPNSPSQQGDVIVVHERPRNLAE